MMLVKTFTFNDFQENTYVVSLNNKCIVIDPGNYYEHENQELKKYIDGEGFNLEYILLTHCHIDHILGLKFLNDNYNTKVYIPSNEMEMYKKSEEIASVYGLRYYDHFNNVHCMTSDFSFTLGEYKIKVIEIPGHSPDHFGFLFEDSKVCFSGDVIFKNSIGRTDLPGGNYETLINSIKSKLYNIGNDVIIYPGHGPKTNMEDEIKLNPFLV